MDEYIDNLFSSSSWENGDVKERSSWSFRETGQPNGLLPTSLRLFEKDEGNSPLSMFSSKQSAGCLPAQDSSSLGLGIQSDLAAEIPREVQLEKKGQNCIDKASLMMNGSLKTGSMCLQYDTALPLLGSLNFSYPKQLLGVEDLTPSLSFAGVGNVRSNDEQFEFHRSFKDLQNSASMQQTWPAASSRGASSVSAVTGQFGIHEGNLDNEMGFMAKRVSMDEIMLDKLSASVTRKDKEDLENYPSSFTVGPNITTATNGESFVLQSTSAAGTGICNGAGKGRVRARRGQATDPHSIAERLRREKIAERMKNLQELVPNASKIDKASMLDEIIEYVKYLQLQVKVLSMSRLGAAGAVVPLITHGQAEGSKSLSLSPSAGLGVDISPSADQLAFEQEVLKLMESNMTMAIQHLQSKGLCLMPIALAAAISSGKASPSCTDYEDKKKISFCDGLFQSSNSSSSSSCSYSGIETRRRSYDGNIVAEQLSTRGTIANGCNGIIEPENSRNNFSRELKS